MGMKKNIERFYLFVLKMMISFIILLIPLLTHPYKIKKYEFK